MGNWVAVWESADSLGGTIGWDKDILFSRSTDAGQTWTDPAALNTDAATDLGYDYAPQITTDSMGNWVAVWESEESLGGTIGGDNDILFSRSTDAGQTWTDPAALNTNAATDLGYDSAPQVTTDSMGNWVAVWESADSLGGTIGGDKDILFSRSTDAGRTWTDPAALNTNAATDLHCDYDPQVTTDSAGNWVAVWTSDQWLFGVDGTIDILFATFSKIFWDYGDAPSPYPTLLADAGARHIDMGPMLGSNRDTEPDGQPTATADGDDTAGTPDDEDGVVFTSALVGGRTASVDVTASAAGLLNAWIDFNGDGDWADTDEQIFTDQPLMAGGNSFIFPVPATPPDRTYARFRLSTAGGLSFDGPAADGEVEDYAFGTISGSKWKDEDGDGTWDGDEPGLEGWTIYVDRDGDGQHDADEASDVTDASGNYTITGLPPGTHALAEEPQGGWTQTYPASAAPLDVTIPASLETVEGNTNNNWPYNTDDMRYQQIFASSDFSEGGVIDEIRYRLDGAYGTPFSASGLDLQINLGYAATTVGTASPTFADNVGAGYVTVLDGLLELSSSGSGYPSPFDIVIDVADLFDYDPGQGDLLLDVFMRSGPSISTFDASDGAQQSTTARITSYGLGSTIGSITSGALVTQFGMLRDGTHTVVLGSGEIVTGNDFGNLPHLDFGDAPSPYPTMMAANGPRHVATGPTLGVNRDDEADGQPTATADGDDTAGSDDEDGVTLPVLMQGETVYLSLEVAGAAGYVDAWIDFNADGDWLDADEQIHNAQLSVGTHQIAVTVPTDATPGTTYARFRISTAGGLAPDGAAPDGEVEDYEVLVANVPPTAEAGGPYAGDEGSNIPLDASGSTDPGNDIVLYEWDLDGDGLFGEIGADAVRGDEIGISPILSAVGLDAPMSLVVSLRVTDDDGAQGQDTATVWITEPLGPVDFLELNDLDPSLGDLRYSLETTHGGFLTIVSLNLGGVVTLYDEHVNPLPPVASERVDWQVAEGEKYYFTLSGVVSDVDLRLANLLSHVGTRVTVHGTLGEDLFEFDAAASRLVTINGVSYHFTDAEATRISFDGGAAADTAVLEGNDGNDTAELWPGHGTLTGEGYRVAINDVETVTAIGGGGIDVALLHDNPAVKDTLTGGPDAATLSGDGYSNQVRFRYVHVFGTSGDGDEALFQGDPNGQDTFEAWPDQAKISGDAYFLRAKSFADVRADGTPGGDDLALLHDDPAGVDTFVGGPDRAELSGSGFFLQANSFRYVHAYGTAGGGDVAMFNDDPARFDRLRAWPGEAKLFGEQFFLRAKSFGDVYVNGTPGGGDLAQLYDSAGDDTFTAWPDRAELSADTFFTQVNSFRWVHAYSSEGDDVATLYGSDGKDVFVGKERFGKLRGTDFYNRAVSFGHLHVYGRGAPRRDVAVLYDAVLETGVTEPVDRTQVAWLYEFERIRQ